MEDSQINITLRSINELPGATAINRRALRSINGEKVNVDFNVRVVPNLERSLISLVVTCSYIAVIGLIRTRVLVCSVISTFEIENLRSHVDVRGADVVVTGPLMKHMLAITVGALRGIVAVRTQGTPLANSPLPIIDLTALLYRLHYGKHPGTDIFRL